MGNNKYLVKLWAVPIVIIPIFLIFLTQSKNTTPIITLVVLMLVFFLLFRRSTNTKLTKALKQQEPDELIKVLVTPLKSLRQKRLKEAYTAYHTALPHVLYGSFSQAEEVMARVDWSKLEPMFQALNTNINCLISYFNNDVYNGLAFARQARTLATVSSVFPGSQTAQMTYDAFVEIGQILNGLSDETRIESLLEKFHKQPLIPKLIIAWGLQHGYRQLNDNDRSKEMRAFCLENAPYCKVLHHVHLE